MSTPLLFPIGWRSNLLSRNIERLLYSVVLSQRATRVLPFSNVRLRSLVAVANHVWERRTWWVPFWKPATNHRETPSAKKDTKDVEAFLGIIPRNDQHQLPRETWAEMSGYNSHTFVSEQQDITVHRQQYDRNSRRHKKDNNDYKPLPTRMTCQKWTATPRWSASKSVRKQTKEIGYNGLRWLFPCQFDQIVH